MVCRLQLCVTLIGEPNAYMYIYAWMMNAILYLMYISQDRLRRCHVQFLITAMKSFRYAATAISFGF